MSKQDELKLEFEIIKEALSQFGIEEAELNPDNKSQFEKQLRSLVDGVDIIKGTKGLDGSSAELGGYITDDDVQSTEYSTSEEETPTTEETRVAGIDFVRSRIEHYLVKPGLTKNILVEYSLLSSTLEPTNPDKLQCISFVLGDIDFKKRINTYYTESIRQTNLRGISVYQHPRFLYNIELNDSPYRESKSAGVVVNDDTKTYDWADSIGVTGTVKQNISGDGDNYKIETVPNINQDYKAGSYKKISGMYVDAFQLDRSFNEMLKEAKEIDAACDTPSQRLVDIQNNLHSFCHRNISRTRGKNSVYISFPIYGSRASNQLPKYEIIREDGKTALQGIGAFFIYFEPEVDMESRPFQKLIEFIIAKIAYEMGNFIRLISANYMFNLGLQLQENARKEALKSARSAIMSRNMSHNLGSHVMSYLKQNLSSVSSVLNDRVLALLFDNKEDMLKNLSDELRKQIENKESEKGALPFLVGLGQFISYLQERQDFIATIATDFIPYLSNVNFKDFVYDELNPDKRYERHKDRKNFKTDNILLGNIARSEGLGRITSPTDKKGEEQLNDIVLKFRSFDGEPVEDSKSNPGIALNGRQTQFDDLEEMRKIDLSLPGGVVGRQAIFSIIENTIRNAAKHGNWRSKKILEISFDIYKREDIIKKIKNKSVGNANQKNKHLSLLDVFEKFYVNATDAKDLYFVTLTDNLTIDEEKLDKLRRAINEPYINIRGEMKEGSKGIKEMRISATWLRNLPSEQDAYNPIKVRKDGDEIILEPENKWDNNYKEKAPILYARMTAENNLQYIFCILRPKQVAIVSPLFNKEKIYDEGRFNELSWGAFTPQEYYNLDNKSYEFIVYDDINIDADKTIQDKNGKEVEYNYDYFRRLSSSRFWKLNDLSELKTTLFGKIRELTDENKNSILSVLYNHLSNATDDESIWVDDAKAFGNLNQEKYAKSLSSKVKVISGIQNKGIYKYVYRSHHDTDSAYRKYISCIINGTIVGNQFVESITGNNSTDRLVRNEFLNDIWFNKHLHAMKERIAIFDERIFAKVYGLEEANLKDNDNLKIDDTNRDSLIEQYFEEEDINSKEEIDNFYNLEEKVIDEKLKEHFNNMKGTAASISEKDSLTGIIPIVYKQKGIYVFSLIQDPDPKNYDIFNLYGLGINSETSLSCVCKKIARFTWSNSNRELNINFVTDEYKHLFDRISIHQGLLDKLYEVFRIKDKPEEKEKLTKKFYEDFSSHKDIITYQDDNNEKYFLPGMCIHSGRSKPSGLDMPQEIPFIQYASIEHAVLDCKYSLVELLDFARYE